MTTACHISYVSLHSQWLQFTRCPLGVCLDTDLVTSLADTKLIDVTDQIPTQLVCITWRGRDKSRPCELRTALACLAAGHGNGSLVPLRDRDAITVPLLSANIKTYAYLVMSEQ